MTKRKPKTALEKLYGRSTHRYLELIYQFPLRPIRTEADLDDAIAVAGTLFDIAEEDLIAPENDYLDILCNVIEKYEDVHYPELDIPNDVMLADIMDSREITQTQLAKEVGIATSTVSEVLSGKRKLTRKQIEKLAAYFKVSPAVFHTKG
jgi:HTH-type transcriptional regulator / antitoxin HigA